MDVQAVTFLKYAENRVSSLKSSKLKPGSSKYRSKLKKLTSATKVYNYFLNFRYNFFYIFFLL